MNIYQNMLSIAEDNAHLISMVPVEELIRLGYEIGLKPGMTVLDLCCGYGTLLKVWNQTFSISGTGVDRAQNFLDTGLKRLEQQNISGVRLVCADVTEYQDSARYDVVICSETISTIEDTFALGKKFLKRGGVLCYQKLYSKVDNPPKELVDFDLEVMPLADLNASFHEMGWYMCAMASDTAGMWEHYVINWSGKSNWENRADPAWTKLWEDMYFHYRHPYEGQAMFALKEISAI